MSNDEFWANKRFQEVSIREWRIGVRYLFYAFVKHFSYPQNFGFLYATLTSVVVGCIMYITNQDPSEINALTVVMFGLLVSTALFFERDPVLSVFHPVKQFREFRTIVDRYRRFLPIANRVDQMVETEHNSVRREYMERFLKRFAELDQELRETIEDYGESHGSAFAEQLPRDLPMLKYCVANVEKIYPLIDYDEIVEQEVRLQREQVAEFTSRGKKDVGSVKE